MKHYFKFLKGSLVGKMLFFFCIVILPVNVIMVIITGFVSKSYEQRMLDSFRYQMENYVHVVNSQFEKPEQNMKGFLSVDNLMILMKGSKTDSVMDMIQINNMLRDSNIWSVYPGLSFVWDRDKDMITFSGRQRKYSEEVKTELEALIRSNNISQGDEKTRIDKRTLVCENHEFLLWEYDYPFYSIGILYDGEAILEDFYGDIRKTRGELYLIDADENTIAVFPNSNATEENRGKLLEIIGELDFENIRIKYCISRSEYMQELNLMLGILYVLCGISFVAIPILWIIEKHFVVIPLKNLCLAMEKVENGDLKYQIVGKTGSYEMDYLYYHFNHMIEELHIMVTESYEKEIEKLQTDSINMRLQVNQHMLLNFLNTVYSLSRAGRKEEAEEFTLLLMNYFRYVLRQDMGLVTVQEEVRFVEDYLKLQHIRFPGSFHFAYSMEDGTENLKIPQLLIENFVENTIKYGLVMGKEIEILINVRTEEEKLILSVCDTGNGMPKERAERLQRGEVIEDQMGKHIGIWNCKRRLDYYYGKEQELTITSSPGQGTQIWIRMRKEPLKREKATSKLFKENKEKEEGVQVK